MYHHYIPLPYPYNIISFFVSLILIIVFLIIFLVKTLKKKDHFTGLPATVTLYYSPNCGHCKAFRGTWNNFVKYLHDNTDGKIKAEEINCESGDCKQIEGVPTIILNKSNNDMVRFVGERSYDNLIDFVKKNC